MKDVVPFNKPWLSGSEADNISDAIEQGQLAGDGVYTKRCQEVIRALVGSDTVLLTHSCTGALEMAAILADIGPGDEFIVPSYTFVSSANAFVLRGARPVFVDIRDDTLNIDENLIEEAITDATKAIVPVHYGGVACEMDRIIEISEDNSLMVIEDAAQAIQSYYRGRMLGGIGHLAAYSFHETKNIVSGEGGALLVNREEYRERAKIIREKGTDRSRFLDGQVDRYTWQTIGSSYLPSELISAFLLEQLEHVEEITQKRKTVWDYYYTALSDLEFEGYLRRPIIPIDCVHNAHMFYVLLNDGLNGSMVLENMKSMGVSAVFHYIPLHDSPAGVQYGRVVGSMENTVNCSQSIIRLPLWAGMNQRQIERVVDVLALAIKKSA